MSMMSIIMKLQSRIQILFKNIMFRFVVYESYINVEKYLTSISLYTHTRERG